MVLSEFTKAWQLYVGIVFLIMVVYAPAGFSALIMLNLRRVKYGEWRKMRWPYAGMLFFGLIALWGFAAIVEMFTRFRSRRVLARADRSENSHWMRRAACPWVTIAVLLIGGFGFEVWRRKFKKVGTTARNVSPRPSRRQRRPSYEPE